MFKRNNIVQHATSCPAVFLGLYHIVIMMPELRTFCNVQFTYMATNQILYLIMNDSVVYLQLFSHSEYLH